LTALESPSTACPVRASRALVRGLGVGALALSLGAVLIGLADGGPSADWTIVFIHVPAAWLSLMLYAAAAGCAASTLQASAPAPSHSLAAVAPVGAAAAFVALWTGLTSQQARGAWWGWDARLICELVLLLLFAGVIALRAAIPEPQRAERAGAVLVLVGALNIPIIYLSVDWWHTVHERAAATVGRSSFAVAAMAAMTLAFCMYAGAVVLARLETLMREREPGGRTFGSARAEGGSARTPAKEQQ
jgi:heme exporter protein C